MSNCSRVSSFERARNLLFELIGESTFYDFIKGEEICIEGKHDTYILKQVDDRNVKVYNVTSVKTYLTTKEIQNQGKIHAETITELYDFVYSFIQNAKNRHIDWNCGVFHIKIPKTIPTLTPPKSKDYLKYLKKFSPPPVERRLRPRFDVNRYTMKKLIKSQLPPSYTTRFYEDPDGFFNPVFFIETRTFWGRRKKHAQINLNMFSIDAHVFTTEGRFLCTKILSHIRSNTNFTVTGIVN